MARAAAFVILVVGMAETAAVLAPGANAVYVYLGSIALSTVAVAAIARAIRPRPRPPLMIEAVARPLALPPPPPPAPDPRLEQELDAAKAVIGDLQAKLERDRATIEDDRARETKLRTAAEDMRRKLQQEVADREAALAAAEQRATKQQREISELRQALSRAAATVADVRAGRVAAEEEKARAEAAIADLSANRDTERTRAEDADQRAAKRQHDVDELRQSLDRALTTVTEITTARMTAEDARHHAVAAAAEEKARSEATIADLTAREIALRRSLADAEARAGAVVDELAAERARAEDAEQRAARLQHDVDELRQSLARAISTVTEITTARMTAEDAQHRATAAAADLAARLEAERVAAEQARGAAERLQRMYDELRESMTQQLGAATAEIDAGRRRAIELQREADKKLNDIVAHLASDHEADIGQATLEKEEARAEVRAMTKRVLALQQRLEHDHEAFRVARDKWIVMQKEHEARQQQAIDGLNRQLREVRAAAAAEIAALRGVPRRRVLIVHRDAALRDLSRRALEPLGYEVLTAADGLEGLRVATAEKPDAVIAETLMPKMDGRTMMDFLKSRADTAGIRVALLAEPAPDAVTLQSTVASVLGA